MSTVYEDMKYDELEAARQDLMQKIHEMAQEQGKIVAVINAMNAKDAAAQKFKNMSEPEKKEMAQLILGVKGIDSKEKVGKP